MKKEGKLCPQNFQVWVAFLMGMVVIIIAIVVFDHVSVRGRVGTCLLYTSPSPRDLSTSRMPSSA